MLSASVTAVAASTSPTTQTRPRAPADPPSAGTTTVSVAQPSSRLTATVAAPKTADVPMASAYVRGCAATPRPMSCIERRANEPVRRAGRGGGGRAGTTFLPRGVVMDSLTGGGDGLPWEHARVTGAEEERRTLLAVLPDR